jgi:hypothetical protein
MDEELEYPYDDWSEIWNFIIEGVELTWIPRSPYLKGDGSDDGYHIISQIEQFIDSIRSKPDGTFLIPPSGPALLKSISSAYTVLFAIASIYGLDPKIVSFSDNAPKWSDLDPKDSEDEKDSSVN